MHASVRCITLVSLLAPASRSLLRAGNGKRALRVQTLWLCSVSSAQPPGPRAFKLVAVGHAHAEHELAIRLPRRYLGEHEEQLARHVCTERGGRQRRRAGTAQPCFSTQGGSGSRCVGGAKVIAVSSGLLARQDCSRGCSTVGG